MANVRQTLTSTGAGDTIDIGSPKTLSFATNGDVGDYTANIEVLLHQQGSWFVVETAITDGEVKTTTGPVIGIRINISALGTATTIDFEVLGIKQ